MAARTGHLFQDKNHNAHINGAGTGTVLGKADFIGPRKARAGGRKPLGDLSNAGKPINHQADGKKALGGSLNSGKPSVSKPSKQLKPKNLTVNMNDEVVSAKASDKSRTSSRKALSDISNLGKPSVPEVKNKNCLKPSSLREESLHPCAIAEEQFLHNHQECTKWQLGAVDAHQLFKTIGLENDDDLTISLELPAISKMKTEIENAQLEFEDVPEQLPEVWSLFASPGSPEHCRTPRLSSDSAMWDDFALTFKLIESPMLSKN